MMLEKGFENRDHVYAELLRKERRLDEETKLLRLNKTQIRAKQKKLLRELEDVKLKLNHKSGYSSEEVNFVGADYASTSQVTVFKLQKLCDAVSDKGTKE